MNMQETLDKFLSDHAASLALDAAIERVDADAAPMLTDEDGNTYQEMTALAASPMEPTPIRPDTHTLVRTSVLHVTLTEQVSETGTAYLFARKPNDFHQATAWAYALLTHGAKREHVDCALGNYAGSVSESDRAAMAMYKRLVARTQEYLG